MVVKLISIFISSVEKKYVTSTLEINGVVRIPHAYSTCILHINSEHVLHVFNEYFTCKIQADFTGWEH